MREERVDIAVIGGVAAGTSAAAAAVRENPKLKVVIFEKGRHISYGGCGIPYFIENLMESYEELITFTPEGFKKSKGVDVRIFNEVIAVDPANHALTIKDLESLEEFIVYYGKLIISTGAHSTQLQIEGLHPGDRIFNVRTLDDAIKIKNFLKYHSPKNVVIIGAGYIGLEMAEAFNSIGLKVTLLELMDHAMPYADATMSSLIEEELVKNNVKLMTSTEIKSVEVGEEFVRLHTSKGFVESEMVIVSVGVEPNVEIAKNAGILLGQRNAVSVDDMMKTNFEDIYACGDCATAKNKLTGEEVYIPLGTTANKQGRIAGRNAAGSRESFDGVLGTVVTKIFDIEYARTGLTYREASQKYKAGMTLVHSRSRAHYYPGGGPVHVLFVYEKGTGRILGAQMAGYEVSKRIDVISTAITNGMTLEALSGLDLSYAPPFAPVWDPILVAANVAKKEV